MLLLNKANFSPASLSGGVQIKLDTMRFSFISRIVDLLKRLVKLRDRGKACVKARREVKSILHREPHYSSSASRKEEWLSEDSHTAQIE